MSLSLFVGIDIGKFSHVASLISPKLLFEHKGRYEACPTLSFEQSRSGFEKLLSALTEHSPVNCCHVLLENTGHYSHALEQYLQEKGVQVYKVYTHGPKKGKQKSDKRDAQALAVLLYNQLERHMLVADKSQEARKLVQPSETARLLRGLVQHRSELVREQTRRKNKLTAIADEVFPEMTQVYANPNNPSALALRTKYPTPQAVAGADLEDLIETRTYKRPGRAKFVLLQELARQTIGTRDESRIKALLIEQLQLIDELKLITKHIEALNSEIEKVVAQSREGQILTSFPMIGPTHAAVLIATIGSIANFESVAKLRGYCGWSPLQQQTGISQDSMLLQPAGNRLLKHTIGLITWQAIKMDTPFKALYDRLVPVKCHYDERTKKYKGKMKVVGRVAGQIIGVIYVLLKRDYNTLQASNGGQDAPEPELYDPKKHKVKRHDTSPHATN